MGGSEGDGSESESAGQSANEVIIGSGSWRGPLRTYCPKCAEFNRAKSMVLPASLNEGHRRLLFQYEPDIAWFRRQRQCGKCNSSYLTGEVSEELLQELYRLRQKEKARRVRAYNKVSADVRTRRKWLDTTGDDVPQELAAELVRRSAWWLTHSSGSPVRAPRHADRMQKLYCGWSVEFGANWFAAGRTLARARDYTRSIIELASVGKMPAEAELKRRMRSFPSGCVLNVSRDFYDHYPENGAGELVFGAQAIDVNDCQHALMQLTGLDDLISAYSKVKSEE